MSAATIEPAASRSKTPKRMDATSPTASSADKLAVACSAWTRSMELESELKHCLQKNALKGPSLAAAANAERLLEAALLSSTVPTAITTRITELLHVAVHLGASLAVYGTYNSNDGANHSGGLSKLQHSGAVHADKQYSAMELLGESTDAGGKPHHRPGSGPNMPGSADPAMANGDGDVLVEDSDSDGERDSFFTTDAAYELYDRLGGWDVLSAAVQNMYGKLFNDPSTRVFFKSSDRPKLMRHMTCFIGSALTGKMLYSPRKIWMMHKHHIQDLGLCCEHVDIMSAHLKDVLTGLGVAEDVVNDSVKCLEDMRWVFSHAESFHDPADCEGRFQMHRSPSKSYSYRAPSPARSVPVSRPASSSQLPSARDQPLATRASFGAAADKAPLLVAGGPCADIVEGEHEGFSGPGSCSMHRGTSSGGVHANTSSLHSAGSVHSAGSAHGSAVCALIEPEYNAAGGEVVVQVGKGAAWPKHGSFKTGPALAADAVVADALEDAERKSRGSAHTPHPLPKNDGGGCPFTAMLARGQQK